METLTFRVKRGRQAFVGAFGLGYGGRALGQRMRDGRSYVGNFTTAPGDELAARAREYLARYGAR
jgi:hypothetical protein